MPLDPTKCSPCAPFWFRELILWPSGGPPVPPTMCCLLQELDATELLLENGSGCIQPEDCP